MNPLALLIDFAADLVRLSEQVGEQPVETIERLAEQLGVDSEAAAWLVTTLARLQAYRPSVFVTTVERASTSDSDSVIVAFTEESLDAALAEEQQIFLSGPDEREITQEELADDDRVVTHFDEVYIR